MASDRREYPRLRADEARGFMSYQQENFRKAQGLVRQMCDSMIKDASKAGKGFLIFDIPSSAFGYNTFDQNEMGRALAHELHADGYDISGTTKKLRITWKPSDPAVYFDPVAAAAQTISHNLFQAKTVASGPGRGRGRGGAGPKTEVSLKL